MQWTCQWTIDFVFFFWCRKFEISFDHCAILFVRCLEDSNFLTAFRASTTVAWAWQRKSIYDGCIICKERISKKILCISGNGRANNSLHFWCCRYDIVCSTIYVLNLTVFAHWMHQYSSLIQEMKAINLNFLTVIILW